MDVEEKFFSHRINLSATGSLLEIFVPCMEP